MRIGPWMVISMLLLPAGPPKENPWLTKVGPAVEKAGRVGTVKAFREALDVAWRADDWQAGLRLAREALEKHGNAKPLHGLVARALWRAGLVAEAEQVLAKLPDQTDDRIGLMMLVQVHLGRGEPQRAVEAADRLAAFKPATAEELFAVASARLATNRLNGIAALIRRAQKLTDPANGYPETVLGEQIAGLAEFFDAVGSEPINRIASYGEAAMPVVPLINLPGCEALINGRGPYRLIVDTGGSVTLSLDDEVAAEIGLKSVAQSNIHGVSGRMESGQALVNELKIGTISCRRVLTRIFGVRKAIAYAADGILGTGLLADGRMTLDFQDGRLIVGPSSGEAAVGQPAEIRLVGDAKIVALVTLQGEPAAALLDSGADALALAPSRLKRVFPDRTITALPLLALGVGSEQRPSVALSPGVDFVLAGRRFENYGGLGLDVLDTLLGPLLGMQTDLLVGMTVMRDMKTLTVDYPRARMSVEWLARD